LTLRKGVAMAVLATKRGILLIAYWQGNVRLAFAIETRLDM
jgi:hypothetical protein